MVKAPSRRHTVGYAIGSVGTGGFGVLPGLVLSYYLTDTLGVAALFAGLIVTLPKIWDVIIDPFIGNFSDADSRRRRSRRPVLIAGAVTLPFTFFLVFATPASFSPALAGAWVVVTFILATTSFSLFQVPYIALPAELADTPKARTAFVAPRIAVLAIAILAFGGGGPVVRDIAGGGHRGYLVMGIVTGVLMGAGMIISAIMTTPKPAPAPPGFLTELRTAALNAPAVLRRAKIAVQSSQPLRALLTTFVLQALAIGGMLAAAPYLATYSLGSEGAASILFVALVAPALLVMPVARRLADRIGKRRAFVVASLIFATGALSLLGLLVGTGPWVYASVGVAGIGYAGMQLYPLAMLPDVIAEDRDRELSENASEDPNGPESCAVDLELDDESDRAGVISGVWTAGETAGMALGPTVALLVLAATGFVSRTGGVPAEQPASALVGVVLIMSLVPATLALVSLIPLRKYTLTH